MKNQITYTEHNGLYYPNLALPEQANHPLGKYANLRFDFMKKHRRGRNRFARCDLSITASNPHLRNDLADGEFKLSTFIFRWCNSRMLLEIS